MTILAGYGEVPGIAVPATADGETIVPDIGRAGFLLWIGFSPFPESGDRRGAYRR